MRIQHNIAAMNSYRNYNTNASALSKNLEKLSSGYRINRAGDDAAGLAISEKMRAQIAGLDQAQANVKDGISLVKTAEGALQEVQDMMNRYTFAVGKDSKFKNAANVVDLTDFKDNQADGFLAAAVNRLSKAAAGNKNFIVGTDTQSKITFTEREGGIDYEVNDLAGTKGADDDGDWTGLIKKGVADASTSAGGMTLQIGDTADSYNQLTVSINDMHTAALGIADIDIGNIEGAQKAIETIKTAINKVSSQRGDLGAIQNRLEHTQNNLSVMEENIQDAESTIRDTDIADEMTTYTKNNILLQSAQAMLAQANQMPQGVLQLLQ